MRPAAPVAVRGARPQDAEAVRALMGELGYPLADGAAFALLLADVLADPRRTLLLAEVGGQVAGCACVSRIPTLHLGGEKLYVDELVVAAAARGAGVGTALLAEVRRLGERSGAQRIELTSNRRRESYRRGFYVKNGFVEADSAVLRRAP